MKKTAYIVIFLFFIQVMSLYGSSLVPINSVSVKLTEDGTLVRIIGEAPINDYTYYDSDPETFVVDLADVDISSLKSEYSVGSGNVTMIKVVPITSGVDRSLVKFEIHKSYLAKCVINPSGNAVEVSIIGGVKSPEATKPHVASPPTVNESLAPPVREDKAVISKKKEATEAKKTVIKENSVTKPADTLISVNLSGKGEDEDITIKTNGITTYKYFTLQNPPRLVVDLRGISIGRVKGTSTSSSKNIAAIRVSQFSVKPDKIARVVVDLKNPSAKYSFAEDGGVVKVLFGSIERDANKTESASQPVDTTMSNDNGAMVAENSDPSNITNNEDAINKTDGSESNIKQDDSPKMEETSKESRKKSQDVNEIAVKVTVPKDSGEFKEYDNLFVAQDSTPEIKSGEIKTSTPETPLSFREKTISSEERKYNGEPITIDLKDADVKDVLRMFHEISKMNIAVSPNVKGRVTVSLIDVPWDQAMQVILKNNGLDYVYDNNVIWVATSTEIAKRFSDQKRLAEEKLKAEDLVTFSRRLSYAKAKDVEKLLRGGGGGGGSSKFLSDKGSVVVDERTNMVIVKDIVSRKEPINKLLDTLDTPIPQVLIEARVVESNMNWRQSFGVDWRALKIKGLRQIDSSGSTSIPIWEGNTYSTYDSNRNPLAKTNYSFNDVSVSVPAAASNGYIDILWGDLFGTFDLDMRLAALEDNGRGRVVSSPRILVQNNGKAKIMNGVKVPVRIVTAEKETVQFITAAMILEISPQITEDGNIIMDMKITNNEPDWGHSVLGIPAIFVKEAESRVKVKDGNTVVIGGTFKTKEGISQSGIPFFSKIPVLGWLFKNRDKTRENVELLIFLTPKVARS